jgi:hypothetical protein
LAPIFSNIDFPPNVTTVLSSILGSMFSFLTNDGTMASQLDPVSNKAYVATFSFPTVNMTGATRRKTLFATFAANTPSASSFSASLPLSPTSHNNAGFGAGWNLLIPCNSVW